jgi:uncharacterized membrane protein
MSDGPSNPKSLTTAVVDRNIRALLDRRQQTAENRSFRDRIADTITGFTGSIWSAFVHLVVFGLWIVINLGWTPLPKFDPTFVVLAMFASVEAIFLTTFVLITQQRMQTEADRRADLDLQISLLSEHEITRLITLVTAVADRMRLEEAASPDLEELKKDVLPEHVLDKLDATEKQVKREE